MRAAAAEAAGRGSIALKDRSFVGEDAVLARELRRRAPAPLVNLTFEPPATRELFQSDFLRLVRQVGMAERTRRGGDIYVRDPDDEQLKKHTILMMEQACYAVQYRFKEADYAIKKYSPDPRFKLGYTYSQLEDWEHEILMLYSYVKNEKRKLTKDFRIYRYIVQYSHAVRKLIDITYTVEYLFKLHEAVETHLEALAKQG